MKRKNERGASAVEYALMVALVAAVIVGAVNLVGPALKALYDMAANFLHVGG